MPASGLYKEVELFSDWSLGVERAGVLVSGVSCSATLSAADGCAEVIAFTVDRDLIFNRKSVSWKTVTKERGNVECCEWCFERGCYYILYLSWQLSKAQWRNELLGSISKLIKVASD